MSKQSRYFPPNPTPNIYFFRSNQPHLPERSSFRRSLKLILKTLRDVREVVHFRYQLRNWVNTDGIVRVLSISAFRRMLLASMLGIIHVLFCHHHHPLQVFLTCGVHFPAFLLHNRKPSVPTWWEIIFPYGVDIIEILLNLHHASQARLPLW